MITQKGPTIGGIISSSSCYQLVGQKLHRSLAVVLPSQPSVPSILSPEISSGEPQVHLHAGSSLCSRLKSLHNWSFPSTYTNLSHSGDVFNNLPTSSTPDLVHTPHESSCTTSPDVPLAQASFTARLHSLLQAIQDQQSEEEWDFSLDTPNYETGWITDDQGSEDSESTLTHIYVSASMENHSTESSDESSNILGSSLDGSTPSLREIRTAIHGDYQKSALTHQNKRKHDDSYELSTSGRSNNSLPSMSLNKRARHSKLGTGSSFSCSKSSPKLKSLAIGSSSSVGSASSCMDDSRSFPHTVIHPPAVPLQVTTSLRDVAIVRLHALLKRERLYRVQDGLPAGPFEPDDSTSNENQLLEADFRREIVQWLFDVISL